MIILLAIYFTLALELMRSLCVHVLILFIFDVIVMLAYT